MRSNIFVRFLKVICTVFFSCFSRLGLSLTPDYLYKATAFWGPPHTHYSHHGSATETFCDKLSGHNAWHYLPEDLLPMQFYNLALLYHQRLEIFVNTYKMWHFRVVALYEHLDKCQGFLWRDFLEDIGKVGNMVCEEFHCK